MQEMIEEFSRELLTGTPETIAQIMENEHPVDLAKALVELSPEAAWDRLRITSLERQASTFGYMDHELQTGIAMVAPRDELIAIIREMRADERADLYNELSSDQKEALMPVLAQAEREDIRRLASYDEDTAGSIMTSDYASLSPDLTATEALTVLRQIAPGKETINRAYIIDADRRLLGAVRLQNLITAPPRARVMDVAEHNAYPIRVDDDVEDAARQIAHYDVIALPVIDHDDRLVGIITHDDALDVMEAEATEDFHRVGTVTNLEGSVATATIAMLYRARIGWLLLLVFGNIFSGAGIAFFEDTIAANLALMFFLPILISSGGNAGAQSATLMIRALATGDISPKDWGRVLGRELVLAILLGLTMSIAIYAIGIFRGGAEIALVVSLSMILIVVVGSLIGLLLPFILSRLSLDPATASTPLVTSIADATGVIIYFSIASGILALNAAH